MKLAFALAAVVAICLLSIASCAEDGSQVAGAVAPDAPTAFAGTGPNERDTKGMADALGWSEWEVGAMILVPTGLDTYRYKHPDAKWAATLSRIAKLYMIFLAVNAQD